MSATYCIQNKLDKNLFNPLCPLYMTVLSLKWLTP